MLGFSVSLLMGVAVGIAYAACNIRSPAPPLVALVGLLGMVLGEQAMEAAKRHFVQTPVHQASITRPLDQDGK
jgi:XapX domain-containing protein